MAAQGAVSTSTLPSTILMPEMKALGSVDIALLPIGGTFTMDIDEAVEATLAIKPAVAIPMHVSRSVPADFKKKVHAEARIEVITPRIGEAFQI
jgi:L-ascorbate metabolism protein UlaG (beta-lactamase superfamily)